MLAACYRDRSRDERPWVRQPWLPAVAALVLLVPLRHHIRRQSERMALTGDKVQYESGLAFEDVGKGKK